MNPICRLSDNTKRYLEHFYCILDEMTAAMTGAELTESISYDFIIQMIPHHRGAIRMSENALHYSICPELLPILEAIICSQKKGVREMEHLLRCIR